MVHPALCQCLSWGGKLLIPGVWKACVGWISTNKQLTALNMHTNTPPSTRTHINKQHVHAKRWSLSHSDRFHSAALYLRCGMSGATMAFDTSHPLTTMSPNFGALTSHNGTLFTSDSLLFFCLISQTKQCYRSTNWAWTIAHKGGTDMVFPALLPTGQCGVKVNWHPMQPCSERLQQLDSVAQICKELFHEISTLIWATASDEGLDC